MNIIIILNMSPHQKLVVRLPYSHGQHTETSAEKSRAKWTRFWPSLCFPVADSASSLHLEANNEVLGKIQTHTEKNKEG